MVIPATTCCCRCQVEKPLTSEYFYRSKWMRYGFHSHCKSCADDNFYRNRSTIRNVDMLLLLIASRYQTTTTLQQRYEVSRRTIYRSLLALEAAGVPLIRTDRGSEPTKVVIDPEWVLRRIRELERKCSSKSQSG